MSQKKRCSGIELLRILTMMGVVLLHYNDGRAFVYVQDGINRVVLLGLESICICAVDLFVLISGYFLSASSKRNYIKTIELLVQLIAFRLGIYFVRILLGGTEFSMTSFVAKFIPNSYFIILYIALYMISPYLNRVFEGFAKIQWNKFLTTIMFLFSVWPTLVDLSEDILGKEWFGLTTIGAWGGQQGFNIVNFVLLYFVGAYLRHNDVQEWIGSRTKIIFTIIITILVIFMWSIGCEYLTCLEIRSAWLYHNPLVILLAALLFVLFKSFTFENKVVNELAKASFTCFLFHNKLLPYMQIEKYSTGNVFVMLIHIVITVVTCYLASYVAYKVYELCTRWLFVYIENKLFKRGNEPC